MTNDIISRPSDGEKTDIAKGENNKIDKILNEINRKIDLNNFSYSIDPLPNIFQCGCIIEKALHSRAHILLVI